MTVLVTGATGFIGSHLVEGLVTDGEQVRALVLPGTDAHWLEQAGVEIVRGDLLDASATERAVSGCDVVYHLGAERQRPTLPPRTVYSINVQGTDNVARAAARSGARRLVFTSATRVYGAIRSDQIDENTKLRPDTPFGESKAVAERVLGDQYSRYGLPVVIARLTSVLGGREKRWVPLFQAIADGSFRLVGRGDKREQPPYVSDVVEGLRLCSSRHAVDGRVYLIAGPTPVRLKTMVELIASEVGAPPLRRSLPGAPLKIYHAANRALRQLGDGRLPRYDRVEFFLSDRTFDLSRARRELGYTPRVGVEEAIRRTAASYREQGLLPSRDVSGAGSLPPNPR